MIRLKAKLLWVFILGASMPLAFAQVSNPLSGALTATTPTSDAASTTSTEIVPGADNLTSDVSRTPYDATGADLASSTMKADMNTRPIASVPIQLDGKVKDAVNAGQPVTKLPGANIGNSGSYDSSFRIPSSATNSLSSSQFNVSSLGFTSRKQISAALTASTWSVVSSPKRSSVSPTMDVHLNTTDKTSDTGSKNPVSDVSQESPSQSTKTTGTSRKTHAAGSGSKRPRDKNAAGADAIDIDTSRSPIESNPPESWDESSTLEEPFKSLDESSFLNTDIITAASKGPSTEPNTEPGTISSSLRSQLNSLSPSTKRAIASRASALQGKMELKKARDSFKRQRPKWHNPILQQMEQESSPQ